MTKLKLEIHEIVCRDETGGSFQERFGGDEIGLHVSKIEPDSDGRSKRSFRKSIGHFNKDGDKKVFQDPLVVAQFNLRSGPAFPRQYQAVMMLVENDAGGNVPVDAIADQAAARAQANPKAGAVATVVVPFVKDWVKERLENDVFPVVVTKVKVTGEDFRFPKRRGDPSTATVKAANGTYQIKYSWVVE